LRERQKWLLLFIRNSAHSVGRMFFPAIGWVMDWLSADDDEDEDDEDDEDEDDDEEGDVQHNTRRHIPYRP
jgi:hypothetical protein